MSWYEDAANQAAAEGVHVEAVHFVYMNMPSGALRLHTRVGPIAWGNGSPTPVWLGVGKLGEISDIAEDAMLRPQGITFKLSGVDADLINAARTENYHGRQTAVYFGFLNTTTLQLVATPQTVFRGLMDTMVIEFGQNTGSITVGAEGELARWQRNNGFKYSTESQREIYPDDKGFDNIPIIQGRTINWVKRQTWGHH